MDHERGHFLLLVIRADPRDLWRERIRELLGSMDNTLAAPRIIALDKAALDTWLCFAAEIENDQGEGGRYAVISDWTGKLPGAAVRIAGLLEIATNGINVSTISKDSAERAIRLARLLIPHAEAAFRLMGTPDAENDALALLEWIKRHQWDQFTRREAHKALESRFRKVDQLQIAIKQLQEWSVLSNERTNRNAKGAPSKYYLVNPKLFVDTSLKS